MFQSHSVVRGASFFGCTNIKDLMVGDARHESDVRMKLDQIARDANYTLFGSALHRYSTEPDDGYSYDGHIGESALDIHTWPENGVLQFVAHTCGNDAQCETSFNVACKLLKELFEADECERVPEMKLPMRKGAK